MKENLLGPLPREEPTGGPEPPEPPYVTGGPPFPRFATDNGKFGISILDYFAAHVIAGLVMRSDSSIDNLKINGAKDAYWIAAQMVQLRDELPIVPEPVPSDGEPPTTDVIIPPLVGVQEQHGVVTVGSAPTA